MRNKTNIQRTIIVNEFTDEAFNKFNVEFNMFLNSKYPIVPIQIESFGGACYSLMPMIDTIINSPKPVATFTQGKAMSAGVVLLAAGTPGYRYVGKFATIMVHHVAGQMGGSIKVMGNVMNEFNKIDKYIFDFLGQKCKHDKSYFYKLLEENKDMDLYLNPQQILKHGIVDHVGTEKWNNLLLSQSSKIQ